MNFITENISSLLSAWMYNLTLVEVFLVSLLIEMPDLTLKVS